MRAPAAFLCLLLSTILVNASHLHRDNQGLSARHHHLARRPEPVPRSLTRRCKKQPSNNVASTNNTGSGDEKPQADNVTTTPPKATPPPPPPPPPPQSPSSPPSSNNAGGTIDVKSNCGPTGATQQTTPTSGPNGGIDWLNCGINDGGWSPPYIGIQSLITQSLTSAIQSGDSPFKACSAFVDLFNKHGGEFGIPPIMLASFALQESSCNPNTVGGAGEQGLMQITHDKCGGAPNGNCMDPDFNIGTAAKYFAQTLSDNGGNVLLAIGTYNGWELGLTYGKATAAAHTGCCRCQNNLDYLQQFLNGWLQNIDAYSTAHRLGKYFNLDICN